MGKFCQCLTELSAYDMIMGLEGGGGVLLFNFFF